MEDKLTRLYYPEDCQRASVYCNNALRILEEADIEESQEDLDWWLEEYEYLYELLSNKPPGLPAIPRTTCDGVVYPSLSLFWRRYHRLKFPVKDDDIDEDSGDATL
jgi:hypothetical protein